MELERCANFYLLMAGAAGALIGLLFVVITLTSDRGLATTKIPIYLTPTVIYFASVLFLAALLSFPNQTRLTATLCICLVGGVGLVYSGSFFVQRSVRKSYYDLHDPIAYAVFPFVAFAVVAWGGALVLFDYPRGLTLVAAGMLLLLAVAIRNSWAIAVGAVSTPPGRRDSM